MFFENTDEVLKLVQRTNFAIIAVSAEDAKKAFQKAYKTNVLFLLPDEKNDKISVEQVRDFTNMTNSRDIVDRFFVVLNSEAMNEAAQNAFLKNLEEPKAHHHFVFVTETPSALLPTVLSRAQVFYLKETDKLSKPVNATEKQKNVARELLTADSKKLIELANTISKEKQNPRGYALSVVGAAIEIAYKSYFATGQEKFLKKLPNLLKLYENIAANGHIKLHIVADML